MHHARIHVDETELPSRVSALPQQWCPARDCDLRVLGLMSLTRRTDCSNCATAGVHSRDVRVIHARL